MNEIAAQIIYYVNSALLACMTYYGFIRIFKPAVKKRWILLAYAGYLILASQLFFKLNNIWWNLLFNIIALVLISLLFSGDLKIRIVFAVLIYIISMAADVISYTGLNYIYYNQYGTKIPDVYVYSIDKTVTNIIYLPFLLISILGFRRLVAGKVRYNYFKVPKVYTIAVLLMLAGIIIIDVLFCAIAIKDVQKEASKMIAMQFVVLIVIFLVIWFYNAILDYLEELENGRLKDQMLERWETQYKTAVSSQKTISDLNHNLKFDYMSLIGILEQGNVEEALKYLHNRLGEVNRASFSVTGNMPIDTMINYYRQRARQTLGIDLKVDLPIPPDLNLNAGLVVTILGNALENAIEACEKVKAPERYISVRAVLAGKEHDRKILITITNPYAKEPAADKDGNLISTKRDKDRHGLGLASVMEMLPEQAGHINLEYANNTFRFMLLLYDVMGNNSLKITNIEPVLTNVE